MNAQTSEDHELLREESSISEILILPDGKILAHNLSPAMASVLAELDPTDEAMYRRANPLHHELPD